MKPTAFHRILPLSVIFSLATLPNALATQYFWDGNDTGANANGGSGTWDTLTTNWDSAATAGSNVAWPSSGTDNDVVFGGTTGTVNIAAGGVTANDITFSTANYLISGGGLTLNGTTPTITNSVTATINAAITTAVSTGFNKVGTGTLILGGSNTFAANTTLTYGASATNSGAIRLANSNALSGVTLLTTKNAVLGAQARIELSNNITVTGIELRGGGRSNSTTTGATLVNISGDNTWAGAVRIDNTGGGHGIRSDAGTLTISGAVNSIIGARTWDIGGAGNVTISGNVTTAVAVSKFGNGTLTLSGSGNTYSGDTRIGAGSLLIGHANALSGSRLDMNTADAGTLGFSGITAATLGGLIGSRNIALTNAASAAVTLSVGNSNIANIYTGLFSGSGHLYKIGTNTFTLDPGAGNSMSLGSLSANAGTMILKSGTINTTGIDPGVAAYLTGVGARGGTMTIDGATLNVGGGRAFKPGSSVNGTANVLSGALNASAVVVGHNGTVMMTHSGGTVTAPVVYHQDGGTGTYTLSGGTLNTGRIYNSSNNGFFNLNLNGGTLQAASGTLNLIDSHTTSNQLAVFLGSENTQIDTTSSNASIARPMADMAGQQGRFTKIGTNTLTLLTASTYSGGTTLSAGTLLANNTIIEPTDSATGSGNITVNGGKLGGTGSIAGNVTVNDGGTISPGASIQSLAVATLSLTNNSTFQYEADSTAILGLGADFLTVNGDLSLAGTVNLTLTDLAEINASAFAQNTVFSLINYTGSWNSGLFTFGGNVLDNGETFSSGLNTWRIDYDATAGGVNFQEEYVSGGFVNLTAIPEPAASMLGGVGLLFLLRRRRNN